MKRSTLLAWLITLGILLPAAAKEVELNGQRFTLPDGYTIEHVAGSPLVDRPVSADFDERGRLYVTDSSGSNEPVAVQREKRPHRIMRLVDVDGDGKFDKSTVFADKLMFPEGSLWHEGSLYVAAPPEIWKFTDTDDDGVADKREVWFDGKTLTHCANDLHGPYLGPDGWFYWCKGAFAEQELPRLRRGPITSKAAHVFRRHPKGGPIEYVMSGGMDNPVELVFTPGGERIFTTTFLVHPNQGLRDGLIHAVYGGVYGKDHAAIDNHPRTGDLLPALSHLGAAAPSGLTRLESDGLGADFVDNLLASSFNMHKITRHVLTKKGATFHSDTTDFLASDHLDFHPTDVLEDADGSVLVVDTGGWFRLCCPTSQLEKADVLGGIYRIRRAGAMPVDDPRGREIEWDKLSTSQLVGLLQDPRFAVRRRAMQRLPRRRDAVRELGDVLKGRSSDPRHALSALWTLTRIDDPQARVAIQRGLRHSSEAVRHAAMHSISLWRDKRVLENRDFFAALNKDTPHVRRAAAEALGRIGLAEHVGNLLEVTPATRTSDGVDRFLEHSLIYAAGQINDAPALRAFQFHENPVIRRAALLALDHVETEGLQSKDVEPLLFADEELLNDTAWWLVERHPDWQDLAVAALRPQLVALPAESTKLSKLRSRLSRFASSASLRDLVGQALSKSPTEAQKQMLLGAMLDFRLQQLPVSWRAPLAAGLTESNEVARASLAVLNQASRTKPDSDTVAQLQKLAADALQPPEIRLRAFLLTPPTSRQRDQAMLRFVCSQFAVEADVTRRSLAVDALRTTPANSETLTLVAAHLPRAGAMELQPLVELFKKSKDRQVGAALVASLNKTPAATALFPDKLEQILQPFGEEVARSARPLLAKIEVENHSKIERVEAVLDLLPSADSRRGLAVFQSTRASCIACHRRGYLGGDIGPDLNRIGKIRNERDLLESILFPSLSFVRSFEPATIQTDDGRVHNGMVRRETNETVTLQLDAKRSIDIPRSTIEGRRMGAVSIMPAGLEKQLTPQELADLVKYLRDE